MYCNVIQVRKNRLLVRKLRNYVQDVTVISSIRDKYRMSHLYSIDFSTIVNETRVPAGGNKRLHKYVMHL